MSPLEEFRARRMLSQLLAPTEALPHPGTPTGVAGWMLAFQGQLHAAGIQGLALRATSDSAATDVANAVQAGDIVRSWSQRGTHHYLLAEDVRWMTQLCSPRVQRASEKRRGQLGLSDHDVDTARAALLEALSEGQLERTACYEVFAAAGVNPEQGRGSHLLRYFGGEGDIIQAPASGTRDSFVLHDDVVSSPRELSGEDALRELGIRYITSRGPVTPQDLSWWSGLTVGDAKKAFALADETDKVVVYGNHLMGSWHNDVSDRELDQTLDLAYDLPSFDEYLLGYTRRDEILAPDLVSAIWPSKNGLCRPFRIERGEIVKAL